MLRLGCATAALPGMWPLEFELHEHLLLFRQACRLTTPSSGIRLVLPRGNAPRSSAYRAGALLLSYGRCERLATGTAPNGTSHRAAEPFAGLCGRAFRQRWLRPRLSVVALRWVAAAIRQARGPVMRPVLSFREEPDLCRRCALYLSCGGLSCGDIGFGGATAVRFQPVRSSFIVARGSTPERDGRNVTLFAFGRMRRMRAGL